MVPSFITCYSSATISLYPFSHLCPQSQGDSTSHHDILPQEALLCQVSAMACPVMKCRGNIIRYEAVGEGAGGGDACSCVDLPRDQGSDRHLLVSFNSFFSFLFSSGITSEMSCQKVCVVSSTFTGTKYLKVRS